MEVLQMLKGEQLSSVKKVIANILQRELGVITIKYDAKRAKDKIVLPEEEMEKSAEILRLALLEFNKACIANNAYPTSNISYNIDDARNKRKSYSLNTSNSVKKKLYPEEEAEMQLIKARLDLVMAKISFVEKFAEVEALVTDAGFTMP